MGNDPKLCSAFISTSDALRENVRLEVGCVAIGFDLAVVPTGIGRIP